MNKAEYRKQYQQQLKAEIEQDIMDDPEKAALLSSPGSTLFYTNPAQTQEEVAKCLATLRNSNLPPRVRALALQKLDIATSRNKDLQTEVLELMKNKSEPAELRHMALLVLQQISFSSSSFISRKPEFMDMLRMLVDEPDKKLRHDAIEILSASSDEYVQRRLLQGLTQPDKALVAPEKAIQFLSYDVHSDYFPLLREIVKNPPNKDCKIEAIRVLGADTNSKELLKELWLDKQEDIEVRTTSAVAVSSIDPAEFSSRARQVVMDDSEDEELRAVCLNAIVQSQPQAQGRSITTSRLGADNGGLEHFIRQVQQRPGHDRLKEATEMYLYNLELEKINANE